MQLARWSFTPSIVRRRKQSLARDTSLPWLGYVETVVWCRNALYSLAVMFHAFPDVKEITTWGGGRKKRHLNNNHAMQRNITCRWMDALYLQTVMFHAFPVVNGRTACEGGRRNGNLITTTQCNAMSLAYDWMHYTHSLSCSCIPSCEEKNNMRGRKKKTAT